MKQEAHRLQPWVVHLGFLMPLAVISSEQLEWDEQYS